MKTTRTILLLAALVMFITVNARQIPFGKGIITLSYVAKNAVRI